MSTAAQRQFRNSMIIDQDAWREGTGYDLDAYDLMAIEEKQTILDELREKNALDWRDMEVLAHDNSKASFDRLRDDLVGYPAEHRARALGYLYDMKRMNDSVFDVNLARIIDGSTGDGTVHALMRVQDRCGPLTRRALLRGVRDRPDVALHFAAAMLDLDGLSSDMAAFDPKFRPTLLKLLPDSPAVERAVAQKQIWGWLKVDPKTIE